MKISLEDGSTEELHVPAERLSLVAILQVVRKRRQMYRHLYHNFVGEYLAISGLEREVAPGRLEEGVEKQRDLAGDMLHRGPLILVQRVAPVLGGKKVGNVRRPGLELGLGFQVT